MASSESDEIKARLERVRKREEDLDGRLALLVAKEHDVDQAALERQLKDLEAERRKAIATGKHGRASAAASGSPQPPISLPPSPSPRPVAAAQRRSDALLCSSSRATASPTASPTATRSG